MKINRVNALRLWYQHFGNSMYAEDFHGYLMCQDGYGKADYYIWNHGERIYCGWNIHHILPIAHGGTNEKGNLLCTNIATNNEASDKITFWIDDSLYQVKKIRNTGKHEIVQLNP